MEVTNPSPPFHQNRHEISDIHEKKPIHLKIDIGKSFQIFTWKLTSDISMSAKSPT